MIGAGLGGVLLAGTVLFACGSEGAQGPKGDPGSSGTVPGPVGSQGPPGSGVDGGLPSSCLSPCHGFNGIVEQWKTSTHYAAYVSNIGGGEVANWTGPQACGNCHAIDALEQRVGGQVVIAPDAGVTNLLTGELGYRSPVSGKLAEASYAGHAKVAAVTCVTCHSVTDQTDPHRTGLPYTPGSFPLRVPVGSTDQASIEKSPNTSAVTGTPAGTMGGANTCIWCHRSRKDVTNYIGVSNSISAYWGPHEGPQADVFSAAGGYQFESQTYGTSTHQQKLTCVDCHMPEVASNSSAADHSFYAQVRVCTSCHAKATSFDISGGQSQIRATLFELQKALNTAGYLTRGTTTALQPSELADGQFELDLPRSGGSPLTADEAGALYDYLLVARGSALGVHNPKYTKQLLFDSYFAITGLAPTTLVRPL